MKKIKPLHFLSVFVFLLMIIIFTTSYIYIKINNKSIDYMNKNASEAVQQIAYDLGSVLENNKAITSTFSNLNSIKNHQYDEAALEVEELLKVDYISNAYIVDQGQSYNLKTKKGNDLNIAENYEKLKNYYKSKDKEVIVSGLQDNSIFIIKAIASIEDKMGKFAVIELDLNKFFEEYIDPKFVARRFYCLTNNEGEIIYNSHTEYMNGTGHHSLQMKNDFENIMKTENHKNDGSEIYSNNIRYKAIAYKQIKGTDLRVAIGINYYSIIEILDIISKMCQLVCIIVLITIMILIIIYFKYRGRISSSMAECCATKIEPNEVELNDNISEDVIEEVEGKFNYLMDENRRLAQEAEAYDNLRNEFFSNISHELKTPLNVLFSTIQVLRLYIGKELNAKEKLKVDRYFSTMRQNGYRLLRIVNNIIYITRIDSGLINLNLGNYNIVDVVEGMIDCSVPYAERIDRKIIFDTEVEELVMAIDKGKVERIILNLISNAFKFSTFGDTIEINIKNKDESVIITVKDSGFGIPLEKQKIIFERFRQVDKLYNRKKEGSGIGLSIVEYLVHLHGGTIQVDSAVGIGTEFIIELPVKIISESECAVDTFAYENNEEKAEMEFSDIEF